MRKMFVVFVLIASFFQVNAQQSSELGISLYPHFSDRRLLYVGNYKQSFIDSIDRNEMSRPSYEISLFWQKRSEKIGFYTGIGFLNTGYRTAIDTIENAPDQYPNANRRRIDLKNINITLPIELNFFQQINDYNEFSFGLGLAFSYNIRNYENNLYYSGNEYMGPIENNIGTAGHTRINTAFQSSVGWKHTFKNGFSFHLEPLFRMWFKPIQTQGEFARNLYSLGIRTSFTFNRTN